MSFVCYKKLNNEIMAVVDQRIFYLCRRVSDPTFAWLLYLKIFKPSRYLMLCVYLLYVPVLVR